MPSGLNEVMNRSVVPSRAIHSPLRTIIPIFSNLFISVTTNVTTFPKSSSLVNLTPDLFTSSSIPLVKFFHTHSSHEE